MRLRHLAAAYLALGILLEVQQYWLYVPHPEWVSPGGQGFEHLMKCYMAWPLRILNIPMSSPWTGVALAFPLVAYGLLAIAFLSWIARREPLRPSAR